MKSRHFIDGIIKLFEKNADAANALAMSRYMKNNFPFFGIKSELRKAIQKEYISNNPLSETEELKSIINVLWQQPQRELHYFAIEMIEKPIKKADSSWMPILEKLIIENSWWDSVDTLAAKHIGLYFKKYPKFAETYPEKWIVSENKWLRRTAILYQLKYKNDTDFEKLKDFILKTAHEKEFFIQKAQGWILREYAKSNPDAVINFINANKNKLSPLTKRVSMKYLPDFS